MLEGDGSIPWLETNQAPEELRSELASFLHHTLFSVRMQPFPPRLEPSTGDKDVT